jgi:hypothetical protein
VVPMVVELLVAWREDAAVVVRKQSWRVRVLFRLRVCDFGGFIATASNVGPDRRCLR